MKFLITFFIFAFALSMFALQPGDDAPELDIKKWVKNGPVNILEEKDKKYYVIEFWATWCPPCLESIPFLSSLQKKFKDKNVIVVGISREREKKITEFVKKQAEMDYHIGIDNRGKTTKAYMSHDHTIPMAFLVEAEDEEATVLWKGHPLNLGRVLEKVIQGKFDLDEYKELAALREKMQNALRMGKMADVAKFAEKILAKEPQDELALRMRLYVFDQEKKPEKTISFIDDLIYRQPENEQFYFIKLNLLVKMRNYDEVDRFAQIILQKFKSKPMVLNYLALFLMENTEFATTPLTIVMKSARKAVKEIEHDSDKLKKVSCLVTLARAHYMTGNMPKAIKTQKKALDLASGTERAKNVKKILEYYQKAMKARLP